MTWLLNQFQKVISTLTKGSSKAGSPTEEERTPSAIANRLSSDINSQRQPASNEPVALRGPFIPSEPATSEPATPDAISNDVPIPSSTEVDTHQRLDVAPAALPGKTITPPSFPTEVSELISTPTEPQQLVTELKHNQRQQASTPAYKDDQPPEIHDLLPAIEPDEPEPNEKENEAPVETTLPEAPEDISPVVSGLTTQGEPDTPVVESAERISTKEEITLFSFSITESEDGPENNSEKETEETQALAPESQALQEESATEEEAQATSEPAARSTDSQHSDQSATPAIEEQTQTAPEKATNQPQETQAKPADSAPENPWLTAVPAQSQTLSAESSTPTPSEKEKTQKAGSVKLLFKLKPGNFHGYIAPYDGTKDILFHQKYINSDIFDHIERGSEVIATIKYLEGKVYATHVALP